jgi:hypothetical protein
MPTMRAPTSQIVSLLVLAALLALSACTPFFDTTLDGEGGGDTGADVGGDAGGGGEPTCAAYCRLFQDACSGQPNHAYADAAECAGVCSRVANWPLGTSDDVSSNTVGCRIYHANAASEGDPELHCGHAGITGGDVCGSWCVNYCSLSVGICDGANAQYDDFEDCLEDCDKIPDGGTIGDVSGNSIQCRMYHLQAASSFPGAARVHCPHTGLESTPDTCGEAE